MAIDAIKISIFLLPEIFEPPGGQLGVPRGVLDGAVAKPFLQARLNPTFHNPPYKTKTARQKCDAGQYLAQHLKGLAVPF